MRGWITSQIRYGTLVLLITAAATALGATEDLVLDAGDPAGEPTCRIVAREVGRLVLELRVPRLVHEDVTRDGRTWQRLSLPGGGLRGREGEAALPTWSRLVAVPAGARARIARAERRERSLAGTRLLPAPGAEGEAVPPDAAYYARRGLDEIPAASVGEPARIRDRWVVPVTFNPVRCDPAAGTVAVSDRITVELDLLPQAGAASPPDARPLPESFARLLGETVIGFAGSKGDGGRGTYLMICPDDATVQLHLDALLDWRRRQGYNVVLATLTQTGSTTNSIKNYIQDLYDTADPPLEYVVLAGDADGSYAIPTWGDIYYGGEGDHYYTTLAGDDVLADVHLGRLSFRTTTELQTIVNKIVAYESDPWLDDDPGWFRRASLTGDPGTSGMSCVYVSQWAKNQLLDLGYAEIDTIFGGNFASLMYASLNRGHTLFTYRGYWGTSNFTTGYINASSNGEKLPFCVVLTCDTGSFESDDECRSEAFLRHAGGGGIGAIGMATLNTHTRYNNCLYHGIVEGALNLGDYRLGTAHARGKLEMYANYQTMEPQRVEQWAVWSNLMGDPATEMWTGMPKDLYAAYPASIPVGATTLAVAVTGSGAIPLAGARVSLYKREEYVTSGLTDAAGRVVLPLPAGGGGTLSVTASLHNFRPHRGSLVIGPTSAYLDRTDVLLDDDAGAPSSGNGDGLVNPGETLELGLELTNLGTTAASGITAVLSAADPHVTILDGDETYVDLGPGAAAWGDGGLLFRVDDGAPSGHLLALELTATAGGESWTSLLELPVHAGACAAQTATFGGPGGDLDPGESGTFSVQLLNEGDLAIAGATATLICESPWVSVSDPAGGYGAIGVGGSAENTADPFGISISGTCYPGHQATFQLALEFASGARDTAVYLATVGTRSQEDPVGPDLYGYYAFDDTDTDYIFAPVYDWIEIDPDHGGSGASLGLSDLSTYMDDSAVVDLPFTFTYYGQNHTRITVCSNGWLAMGNTYLVHYRNWSIPCAGAPDDMIAVFWDDLEMDSGSDVLVWEDTANHRFVVEWSRMRNAYNNSLETFQAILYDPAHHPTDTGDGPIEMQYQQVANVGSQTGHATVGIQNHDTTDGLLYTYWAQYPAGASILSAGRAIRFQPVKIQSQGYLEGDVSNLSGGGTPLEGATVRILEAGRSIFTQADGHYFGTAPAGEYTVFCEHPSFLPDTAYAVTIVEDGTTLQDFALVDVAGPDMSVLAFPGTEDTAGPYVVDCWLADHSSVADGHFYYTSSATGGPHELSLQLVEAATGHHQASIPGQPSGTLVQYWLTAADAVGNASREPADAPWSLYSFQVGGTTIVFEDDMETNQGWTGGQVGDTATSGLWVRVDPNGVWEGTTEVQPEDDATPDPGVTCWITGNDPAGSAQGVDDVDGGSTTLLSPWIDLSGVGGELTVELSYRRWFSNDTGLNPGEDPWVVEVTDDGSDWATLENTLVSDRSWAPQTFDLEGVIPLDGLLRARFVATDGIGGSLIEAGVDDVVVLACEVISDGAAPTVTVGAPDGGEGLSGGQSFEITWSAADDIGVVMAHVLLSQDGGATYPDTLVSGFLNGSWTWTVPEVEAPACRIRVVVLDAAQNEAVDESDADFGISSLSGVQPPSAVLALGQNRPNPFNPRTEIAFRLPRSQQVALRIYDLEGKLVRTLVAGRLDAGPHVAVWEGMDERGARVASGLYIYRLETPDRLLARKMLLLK